MRIALSKGILALAACFLISAVTTGLAYATPGECQRAIIKEYRRYARNSIRDRQKCEDKIVHGSLPMGFDCASVVSPGTFGQHVASACGGNNHSCNVADTGKNADETLASVGWDIGACPDIEGMGCANTIADCNDIVACLVCVTDVAVSQSLALYYDALNIPTTDRGLEKCQREIGKRGVEFVRKKLGWLARCERHVLSGDVTGPCPDAPTQLHIDKADVKARAQICRKCGGDDKLCGGSPDRTTAEIGFSSDCPDVTIPGGAACSGAIATVDDIATCVTCVSEFKVDCLDALSVPALKAYPSECNAP